MVKVVWASAVVPTATIILYRCSSGKSDISISKELAKMRVSRWLGEIGMVATRRLRSVKSYTRAVNSVVRIGLEKNAINLNVSRLSSG